MRLRSYSWAVALAVFFQGAPAPKLFPIPGHMEFAFPGVNLSETNGKLLQTAFGADWKEDYLDAKKLASERIAMAGIALGKLGSGIVLKVNDEVLCGTGGCPLYVYVREKVGYRVVAKSFGWAYGVVATKSEVPDLAFASNGSGGRMTVTLQSYDGQHFVDKACEMLVSGDSMPPTPDDWFNPAFVQVRPCENLEASTPE